MLRIPLPAGLAVAGPPPACPAGVRTSVSSTVMVGRLVLDVCTVVSAGGSILPGLQL